MEISAKERLTGAVILVALIVLVVPELLSGPRRSSPQPSEAAGEPPLRSYTVRLNDEARGASAAQSAVAAPAPESAPQPAAAQPVTVTPPETVARPAATGPAESAASGKRGHAADVSAPKSAAGAVSAGAGWQVQVGSFGSRDHADRLAHQLKSKGFGASVSQSVSHGRKWYRVRVGPERDRTAALAMARRLHAAGEAAVVQGP